MGAVAGIELQRPIDASDILETGSVTVAKGEVIRLREKLGLYAKQAGFGDVVYDASDLVLGVKESEDFDRYINNLCTYFTYLYLNEFLFGVIYIHVICNGKMRCGSYPYSIGPETIH